jgi:hypothetical protein
MKDQGSLSLEAEKYLGLASQGSSLHDYFWPMATGFLGFNLPV